MYRYVFVMLFVVAAAHAQLTFSTDWGNGKRSVKADPDGCASDDSVIAIYKLIQKEAVKFLACQMEGKN